MIRRSCTALYLLIALGTFVNGESSIERLPFSTLATEDGLSNDSIYCLLQDRRGFIWIGTFGGLDRYDGKEMVSFKPGGTENRSLSASVIFALAESADGKIWIGTDGGGLNRLDPESGFVEVFRGSSVSSESSFSDLVYSLASETDGDLWIGTGGSGLVWMDGRTGAFHRFKDSPGAIGSDIIRALLLDRQNRLWVGMARGGLAMGVVPKEGNPHFEGIGLHGTAPDSTIRALYEDSGGKVWIGTEGDGLYLASQEGQSPRHIFLPDSIGGAHATIRSISSDETGRVWVGTEGSGLVVLEADGGNPLVLQRDETRKDGLSGNQVRAIIRDHSGLMWVGLKDRGLSIGNPAALSFGLHPADGSMGLPRGTIRAFSQDTLGGVWLASDGGGLVRWDPVTGGYRMFGTAGTLSSDRLCSVLVARDGSVYAGSDGSGLFRLADPEGPLLQVPLRLDPGTETGDDAGVVVWAIFEDSRSRLWIGLEGSGLIRFDPDGTKARYRYDPRTPGGLTGRSVRCLLEDSDGSILVGTWDGGLHRIDPSGSRIEHFPANGGDAGSTSDVSIYCLLRDSKGRVWIGTGSGLDRWERGNGAVSISPVELGPLPRKPGIFGIAEDSTGALWLSTESGLLRYEPETGVVRSWTKGDGLQGDHFAPGAYIRLADGRLAFGGAEGFNIFNPAEMIVPVDPPPVRFVSLVPLEGEKPAERSSFLPSDTGFIRVPWATSGFALTLAVLDFTDPDKNLHALRIEGRRNQRYYLGTNNTAVIPRLSPGRYRFIAVGAGNRGLWNESGAAVTVEVVPPFWMSFYFISGLVALAAFSLFFAVRLRVRNLERKTRELRDLSAHVHDAREEERSEIAREVHDQLGQTLTAVKIGLFWAKQNSRISAETMEERLAELLEYTDLALESVKSISTRLRPTVLDTLSLHEALEWLVRDFSRWSGIKCVTDFNPAPFDLERRTKTTVFRVLQENLTNVARHSGAAEVNIRLVSDNGSLELTVRDNGRGIDLSQPGTDRSFGIAGMRERCSYLGGSFDIFPAQTGGTVMIARLPILVSGEADDA